MAGRSTSGFLASLVVILFAGLLAACNSGQIPKDLKPVPNALLVAMHEQGMDQDAPIFIRIFKQDSQFEVWKQKGDGTYGLLKTYNICQWSGTLGPKKVEGDYQAPEGFYTVNPAQMNPNSAYYLSFNIGYPNAYDSSLGRTGGDLMVHGACSSAGCYSMTDEAAGEIFALARDAFRGGQREFQIQAFPFRMTPENMAKYYDNPNIDFWRMLKVGYDSFELTHKPPKVDVCDKQYVFNADAGNGKFDPSGACPAYSVPEPLATALAQKQSADDAKIVQLVAYYKASGGPPDTAVTAAVAPGEPVKNGKPPEAPSLLARLGFGGGAPAAAATPVPVGPVVAATTAAPTVAATTPVPPTPTVKPATAPAGGATTAVAAQPAPANGQIGTLVDRKFWWDDVVGAVTGGAT